MIGVVVKQITARLVYTMDFVFAERGVSYELLLEKDLEQFRHPFLSYGVACKNSIAHFEACTLLFEEDVYDCAPEKVSDGVSEFLAFDGVGDLFASIFYVLSRYEEYDSKSKDEHGRFPAAQSLQFAYGWLDKAICDRWCEFILNSIGEQGSTNFRIVPSFDIDNTFAYLYKNGWRGGLSYLKDLKNRNFERIRERRAVRKGAKDPYDTFEKIRRIQQDFPDTLIFWLVAPLGEKDRNLSAGLKVHQELMRAMDAKRTVGLHPGYASDSRSEKIREEKVLLEKALGRKVSASRQHFLRFRIPSTYRSLLANGFTDEYSMGYAEIPGFRAGTARAFHWFDLGANAPTNLRLHPFIYMDGTLNEYLEFSIEKSQERISELFNEVKRYGGDFVCIWHNETIGDYRKWKGWSAVLDYTLNLS